MSIIRTASRSVSYQTTGFRVRSAGVTNSRPPAPFFNAAGGATTGVASITPAWPTRHQAGDLGILVIEASGGDATATVSGWTHIAGSPVVDIADATGSKLMVLWRFAETDSESQASIPDLGDHATGRIYGFRGVRQDIVPGRVYATDTKVVASTSVNWPAITTLSPNNLVLCIASRPDDSASNTTFSAFANANLTSVAETGEAGSSSGDGGGFVVNHGTRAAIGNIGTSSGTMTVSVTNALMTFALEPSLALPA
jgi:hypothetical protein